MSESIVSRATLLLEAAAMRNMVEVTRLAPLLSPAEAEQVKAGNRCVWPGVAVIRQQYAEQFSWCDGIGG